MVLFIAIVVFRRPSYEGQVLYKLIDLSCHQASLDGHELR